MISLCLVAQRAIQRRSLDEIAEGQVRRVQIRRRSLDECWFTYTPEFRAVRVKSPSWILIGRQSGMLWMLWAQEGPRMLHWGTPVWPAGSRPLSWKQQIFIGWWPHPGYCAGTGESWITIGWRTKLNCYWLVNQAELLLAESPGCFPLRRQGHSRLGSLREVSCGDVFSEGEGEARSPGHRAEGVTGSGTQFRWFSKGGRVTSPPRKTTRRPWRAR